MTEGGLSPRRAQDVALVELLDRLLAGGVVLAADVTISVADVDLVYLELRALISSIDKVSGHRGQGTA